MQSYNRSVLGEKNTCPTDGFLFDLTTHWEQDAETQIHLYILNKNINATCNNFQDFTELQLMYGNQSIEMYSLAPNLWISHDWEYRNAFVCHRYLKKQGRAWIRKQVSIWCDHHFPQRDTSPSHRVDQAVDCVLWNVVPLLFNGCDKLLDIGEKWNTLSYTSIQSIPNMLNV